MGQQEWCEQDSKEQRKFRNSGGQLLDAVEGHNLE